MPPKVVVLAGARSLWAQQQYLPVLLQAAISGQAELWATDVTPRFWLRRRLGLRRSARVTLQWLAAAILGRVHYLRFARDGSTLQSHPAADYVFIVAADPYHSRVARYWLDRLNPGGKIFIEKPLAATLAQGDEIKRALTDDETVFGFTHFLARVYPFLRTMKEQQANANPVRSLDISLLEQELVPADRMEPLREGAIIELFPHILAVAASLVLRRPNLAGVALPDVEITASQRFKLTGWTMPNESAARIEFRVGGVPVISRLGKSVGKQDCKQMIISRAGQSDFTLPLYHPLPGLVDRAPVASFLRAVLAGKGMDEIPGLLSFDAIYGMLVASLEARDSAAWGPAYEPGARF
jgi:predicted dehydrogenase